MVGKFGAVLGPFLVGSAAALTGDPRLSLLPILLLFVIGAALLWRVDVVAGRADAARTGTSVLRQDEAMATPVVPRADR